MRTWILVRCASALAVAVLLANPASADTIFTVSLDTTPLVGSAAAPFSLFFQLTDGGGVASNTVTLSNFTFGTGGASGAPALSGGASGSLTAGVSLTDTDFFNSFEEFFTPGALLRFDVHMTTNVEPGPIPDAFGFSIFDSTGGIFTVDPSGAEVLLRVDIDSASPQVLTYGADPTRGSITMDAPVVTTAVPEPGTLLLIGPGLAAIWRLRRRNR
jgi:hypothetical protein